MQHCMVSSLTFCHKIETVRSFQINPPIRSRRGLDTGRCCVLHSGALFFFLFLRSCFHCLQPFQAIIQEQTPIVNGAHRPEQWLFFMNYQCDNALYNMYSLRSFSTCLVLKSHFCPCMLWMLHRALRKYHIYTLCYYIQYRFFDRCEFHINATSCYSFLVILFSGDRRTVKLFA
jgi:hypothetical protein